MDIATIVGVISAFGLVLVAIFMGGGLNVFINVPALMIVVGGTMGVTMINYPLKDVFGVIKVVRKTLFSKTIAVKELIERFVNFANKTRREGILALESEIKTVQDDFLKKGVQLSIDGLEPQEIQDILETELDYVKNRHSLGAEVFTSMGTFAPAMGIIGTLIGLVQMLQSMDDPSSMRRALMRAILCAGAILATWLSNWRVGLSLRVSCGRISSATASRTRCYDWSRRDRVLSSSSASA